MMSKPTKLGSKSALELFRFAVEQLVKAIYPNLDPRCAATRALAIESAILNSFKEDLEEEARELAEMQARERLVRR